MFYLVQSHQLGPAKLLGRRDHGAIWRLWHGIVPRRHQIQLWYPPVIMAGKSHEIPRFHGEIHGMKGRCSIAKFHYRTLRVNHGKPRKP